MSIKEKTLYLNELGGRGKLANPSTGQSGEAFLCGSGRNFVGHWDAKFVWPEPTAFDTKFITKLP